MNAPASVLALDGGDLAAPLLTLATAKATARGAAVETLALHDLALPVYSTGPVPSALTRLSDALARASGVVVATPEVVGAAAPVVLNALAWLDRAATSRPVLRGKTVALLSVAAPGAVGVKALTHLAAVLGGLGALVMPYPIAVQAAQIGAGGLTDPGLKGHVELLGERLLDVITKLGAPRSAASHTREIRP